MTSDDPAGTKREGDRQAGPRAALLMLGREVSIVERIAAEAEAVEKKLERLYAEHFPKTCACCGRTYTNRDAYLEDTLPLPRPGTIFEDNEVQEYRNCRCGSTLLLLAGNRRDDGRLGAARRELFERCVRRLAEVSEHPEADLRGLVRQLFREVTRRATRGPAQEEPEEGGV